MPGWDILKTQFFQCLWLDVAQFTQSRDCVLFTNQGPEGDSGFFKLTQGWGQVLNLLP